MAIDRGIRLLTCGLLIGFSASSFSGQQTQAAKVDAEVGGEPVLVASVPKTLAELPPKQPKVTCRGDQLAISAQNSTLGSVLAAVHSCTGVRIDVPEGSAGSRTYEELGPGPVRQVLESLLSATEFNYVIESSDENPQKVEAVLLMLKATDGGTTATVAPEVALTPARRAWLLTQKNGRGVATPNFENRQSPAEVPSPVTAEEPTAVQADNSAAVPAVTAAAAAEGAPAPIESAGGAPPDAMANPSQAKPTEDKITDMQQLFEQRRQMIENSSSSPKP